jgi:hypothetical protein
MTTPVDNGPVAEERGQERNGEQNPSPTGVADLDVSAIHDG